MTEYVLVERELLPCPFCRSKAEKASARATKLPLTPQKVSCSNSDCAAHFAYWHPDEWNRRAQPAQTGEPEVRRWKHITSYDALAAKVAELEAKVAGKDALIQEMVRIAAEAKRPAYDEQQRRMAELEAQLEELAKDAERYRWLRDTQDGSALASVLRDSMRYMWDAAIDAAMKPQPEGIDSEGGSHD